MSIGCNDNQHSIIAPRDWRPAPDGRRFDLIVFDWDGTLMDSAAAIVTAIQRACGDLGFPVPGEEQARYIIGLGLHDALSRLLPGVDPVHHPRVADRYRLHYLELDGGTTLFPGAFDMVAGLHRSGTLLAIATGKGRRGLERALGATGLTSYFHASRCGDDGESKPHPGMLNALMDGLGIARDRTLMIGDTTHDLAMADAAGVAAVGVTYGAHRHDALLECGPLACLGSVAELSVWLKRHA